MAINLKYFAIRMGNYVEVRASSTSPKPKVSRMTKTFIRDERKMIAAPDPKTGLMKHKYMTVPMERKLELKQTFYVGGKVIGTCKYGDLCRMIEYDLARKGTYIDDYDSIIPPNGMVEISRETRKRLIRRSA